MRFLFVALTVLLVVSCSQTKHTTIYDDSGTNDDSVTDETADAVSDSGDLMTTDDDVVDSSVDSDNSAVDEITDSDEIVDIVTDEDGEENDTLPDETADKDITFPDEVSDETTDETADEISDETGDETADETADEVIDEIADETPDADEDSDVPPPIEICDGKDNDGDGDTDEGCNDDGDDYCDINMYTYGLPAICPKGGLDCDDNDPQIYPFSDHFKEGVDYDCDDLIEYGVEVVISVDDTLIDMCVNSEDIESFGSHYGTWTYADTYNHDTSHFFVMESGENVIGIHGKDSGTVISAFMATVKVNGTTIVTDGVMPKLPPSDPIVPYTPSDPQWTATDWRYYPSPATGSPNGGWCDAWFNDDDWGPAIRAGIYGSSSVATWGELGSYPWTMSCGSPASTPCPSDFRPYYSDSVTGNEPMWIWDYNPSTLQDAWFRLKITLP